MVHNGSAQNGSAQNGSAQTGSAQNGSAQNESAQSGQGQEGAALALPDSVCIRPEQIQEGDLTFYLSGRAGPELLAHIQACPHCQAEAAALQETNLGLVIAHHRRACPDVDQLLQAQLGMLSLWDAHALKSHVTGCSHCQGEMRELESGLPAPSLGQKLWERVRQIGQDYLRAVLQPTLAPIHAVRGGEQTELHFRASACEVVLAISLPVPPRSTGKIEGQLAVGQLELMSQERIVVGLFQGPLLVEHDVVDEFGYFSLGDLGPGEYNLWIGLAKEMVCIEHLIVL